MKKILILAPSSFPIINSEAIVNAKFAYVLAQLGYDVTIFSRVSNMNSESLYPVNEQERMILKSKNIKIRYIPVVNGKGLLSLLQHLLCFCKTGYVYRGANWNYYAIKEALKLSRKEKFDVLVTRGFYTDIAGIYLVKKLNIKWIANWNDPYPLMRFPAPYGHGPLCDIGYMQESILRGVQKHASLHTFPSARLRDYMLKYLNLIEKKNTEVIPHLAHESFFLHEKASKREKIRLLHAGNVSFPRSPRKFLEGLSRVCENPVYADIIECVFVGKQTSGFNQLIKEFHLESVVKILPPVDYFEVLKLLSDSDISIIIEAECDEGIYLPTKFVDAMQSQIPVLCVSPAVGTLCDIIDSYNVGYFADNSSVDDICLKLKLLIDDWKLGKSPVINLNQVSIFFNKSIGNKYQEIIESNL